MCAELADLGMDLARAAAARALENLTEPTRTEEPPPEPAAEPPPEPVPASAATPRRTAGIHLRAPSCKAVDPALLFTHLTATVLSCITLEARLMAGTQAAPRAAAFPATADPRRTPLRETFRHLTTRLAGQAALLREINTHLDQQLAADPTQTLNLPTLFTTICENLNFEPDFATLPDQYLDLLCDDPNPQATSPP